MFQSIIETRTCAFDDIPGVSIHELNDLLGFVDFGLLVGRELLLFVKLLIFPEQDVILNMHVPVDALTLDAVELDLLIIVVAHLLFPEAHWSETL